MSSKESDNRSNKIYDAILNSRVEFLFICFFLWGGGEEGKGEINDFYF